LGQGSSNPFSVTVTECNNTAFTNSMAIWIDFNQNGVFETTEQVYVSPAATAGAHTESGTINIPSTATAGTARMRVVCVETTTPGSITACGTYGWGETEDYNINIVSCVAGAFSAQPANATITCNTNTSFAVTAAATGIAYQWQVSIDGGLNWSNITNGGVYGGATTNTLSLTNVPASYNGYKYRCNITGTCTPANTNSNVATLTVNQPVAPTVFPNPASTCLGTTTALNITTGGGYGPPVTVSFTTGPITVAVPDNNQAGATSTIAVSGIPAGSLITSANVTWNMTHTWDGDMVFALKAPNNNILNLDYYLSGTGGAGATTGFVNTNISSAGVTALSAGTGTYTGTFRADANVSAGGGPTGFTPTGNTWPQLYSIAAGNWVLGMYDGGAGDVGTLTNWTINLTYTPPVPYAGIWTPNAGLFTNAQGTTPYAGTALSTVYANPAANTTYSVTYTVGTCPSPPTSVPVTVNIPVSITGQPVNKSVCTDQSVNFTVTAAGSSPTYQWQVSTNNGTSYSNVANGVNYSGATTNTLTVIKPPVSWSTYKYQCVVTGAAPCGSVTTTAAILTVNPLPTVSLSVAPYTSLFPGLRTTLTTTSSPAGASYAWYWNTGLLTSVTTASNVVDVDGLGDYKVTVTDINGCINTTNVITINDSATGKIFIYPSPNSGRFQVRFYSVRGNQLVRGLNIYDEKGARVLKQTYSIGKPYDRMDVDLRNHGKGIYRVELVDGNGKRLATGNVVVL
jgi:subtilisin-like proprotein convertase family protein